MKFRLVFLLLGFSLHSCFEATINSETDKNYSKSGYELKVIDSIVIPISKSIKYTYNYKQVIEKGDSSQLLVSDLNGNGFFVIDLGQKKVVKRINYDEDKIEGDKNGRWFYYHNPDSIFVFGQVNRKVYLTDESTEVKKEYDLPYLAKFRVGEPIVQSRIPPSFQDSLLTFCLFPTIPLYESQEITDPVYANLNIQSSILNPGTITYKEARKENRHPVYMYPTGVFNKNEYAFCFPFGNNIYVYDPTLKETRIHNFLSSYIDNYDPMTEDDTMREFDITGTNNQLLLYDPHRAFYYLFVELGLPLNDVKTGEKNTLHDKPFSIIVFDDKFKKLTEVKIQGGKYTAYSSFVTKNGLYLFKNNPKNPEFDEDFYKFDIITFHKPDEV